MIRINDVWVTPALVAMVGPVEPVSRDDTHRSELLLASGYTIYSDLQPAEVVEALGLPAHERQFEDALIHIARYRRGGDIRPGTVEADRDAMIGLARETLRLKYGMAWRERVGGPKG